MKYLRKKKNDKIARNLNYMKLKKYYLIDKNLLTK